MIHSYTHTERSKGKNLPAKSKIYNKKKNYIFSI